MTDGFLAESKVKEMSPTFGLELKSSRTYSAKISSIYWSPDGTKLALDMDDGTLSILDYESNSLLKSFNYYDYFVNKLNIFKYISGSNDRTGISKGSLSTEDTELRSSTGIILNVVWSPDSTRLFLSMTEGIVSQLNLANEKPEFVFDCKNFFKKNAKSPTSRRFSYDENFIRLKSSPDFSHSITSISSKYLDKYLKGNSSSFEYNSRVENFVIGINWSMDGKKLIILLSDDRFVVFDANTCKINRISRKPSVLVDEGTLKQEDVEDFVKIGLNGIFNNAFGHDSNKFIDYMMKHNTMPAFGLLKGNVNENRWAYSKNRRSFAFYSLDSTIDIVTLVEKDTVISPQHIRLEGHTASIISISFSPNGRFLASKSLDNTFRIWNCNIWEPVAIVSEFAANFGSRLLAFHPCAQALVTVGEFGKTINLWRLNFDILTETSSLIKTVHYASAKVVLVGESNVGKSCLALRLAEDRYEELGTTHGTRFWSITPNKLNPDAEIPVGKQWDIVLWDMGGQNEYRLVHQLFLNDVALALILLDPTRGRTAFEEVEGWSKRLDKQLGGRKAVKMLVGTKMDQDSTLIDRAGLERLAHDCKFEGYYLTGAKTGRGIPDLRKAIFKNLDWDTISNASRPKLFQQIRDDIENLKNEGEIVISLSDLEKRIHQKRNIEFDSKAIDAVVKQLAVQGVISDTQIDTGERMLVLQIGEIERYAGSLIISARNNPRGVPAIEKIMVASPQMSFPGIEEDQRLARIQERVILECVMQLLIEHGICLQHEGLLIFPSLFQPTEKDKAPAIPHSISLYYDFSGAIDNIYSSLVAWLGISGYFGRPRLWDDRAEFEMIGQGACGLRKIDRGGGFAHLDIYFEDKTPEDIRNIFINFVEEHLHEYGIEICETIEITCSCSFSFSEASIRRRISEGFNDIGCPECDKRIVISEGALKAREEDPELEQKSWALKTDIQAKKNKIVANVKKEFSKLEAVGIPKGSIWILHLSDLHMTSGTDFFSMLQPLISDLNKLKKELAFDRLNYLVISGDLTNYGKAQEYEVVRQFISKVIENFELSAERCIIVPGNHDIDWDENVYDWKAKRVLDVKSLEGVSFVEQGNGYLVRNTQKYPQRFSSFSKNFYHPLIQREYPLESKDQCILTPFYEDGLQFLAMNSCWEIDEFHQTSSSINLSSLSRGLCKANEQIKQFPIDRHILRIAVWHHPVTGNDKISDDAFLEQLRKENFALCLHGHVHEDRSDIIGYLHERKIRIAGAGSFGVPACDRPESVPRLYTLLEITRDHSKIKVHTRCLHKEGGAWDGYANGIPSLQRKKEHIMRLF